MSTSTCVVAGCNRPRRAVKGVVRSDRCRTHDEFGDDHEISTDPQGKLEWIATAIATETDECLPWPWGKDKGYGAARIHGIRCRVHNYILRQVTGDPPQGKDCALHSCHNRACCNPRHLRWGDRVDNNNDCTKAGRWAKGEGTKRAKLNPSDVRAIRKRYAAAEKITEIHKDYPHVNYTAVKAVCKRRTWKHIS